MTIKTKIILKYPVMAWWIFRSKKLSKKIKKMPDDEKYTDQWRNDYILKRAKKVLKLLRVELTVKGFENLPKAPAVLAPNHTSYFDVPLIIAALENPAEAPDQHNYISVFLAKMNIKTNKRSRGFADMINSFYINRENPRQALLELDKFAEHAKEHKKYATIFPEGTRSKDGLIHDFKGGAFRIAKKTFVPIVPVTINNSLSITDFSRTKKLKVEVIFGRALKPISFIALDNKSLAARVQKEVHKGWKKPEGKRSDKESAIG